ncbi:stimulated by retinoic acid gene 6 protein-like isoform X2 [Ruditapes philippinarum]|uniref:stimulated by retinoic acid gene 6 protein-like isoform X2 n=1 Tax=Ruditapes philippinarum TaxID=129788 RepID=UPI00295BFBE3|nr:stimulated by retinoic acid gene 6 protein-like isoform X2 [Ruditapes philippinarum]
METTTVEPLLQFCYDNVFETNISVDYIHWFLIPAVAIMLLLCFMEKRKTFKPNIMGGRPAVVRPLGFLDEPANRWGVMFVFGSVTGNVIQIAQKAVSDELNWPIWARIFMVYILCLETSVVCYPLFACMTTRHKLVGAIAGLLYSLGWFTLEMVRNVAIGICFVKYVDPQRDMKMSAHILIQEMPVTICNFLVVLKFCWKLYKCLRKGIYKISHEEHVKLCKSYHLTYVKHLLNKRSLDNTNETLTWKQKIHRKIIRPVPGFRFPISITITSFMSGVLLYMVGLYCAMFMEIQSKTYFIDFVDLIRAANVIATMITLLCGIRNIYILLMNYRRDMLLLFKGDKSFIPNTVQTPSPNVYMAQGMRFIGTSITGMFWGTVFCYLLVFVPLALMFMIIKILNLRKELDEMWKQFQWLIYPICMVIIFKVQTFLIGRYFIQPKINAEDKYRPLAVDNRNIYDVFSFFTIFLNASIGLFTFLKRILLGAFLGVFMIPRMDRSLLMRGYEAMDKCYVNYIGMIMVDVAHNHPVMRVFCFLVKSNLENRRDRKPLRYAVENAVYGNLSFSNHIPIETGNSIAKRRWWLALTLIRNPSLVALRVRESKREESRHRTTLSLTDIKCDDKTAIVDQENSADAWGFSIRCCRNYKFEIPSNILINLMALIVLLSVLVIYTGFPILLRSLMEEAEALAQAT